VDSTASLLVLEQLDVGDTWLDDVDALCRSVVDLGFDALALGRLQHHGTPLDVSALLGAVGSAGLLKVGPLLDLGHGRLASMMAREVTTLDHLIGAGSLLVLRGEARDRLDDAASVAHGLFTQGRTTAGGAIEYVEDAANLPAPTSSGGPLLVAWDAHAGDAFVVGATGSWEPMALVEWDGTSAAPEAISAPLLVWVGASIEATAIAT
jgi:hypothetical protein